MFNFSCANIKTNAPLFPCRKQLIGTSQLKKIFIGIRLTCFLLSWFAAINSVFFSSSDSFIVYAGTLSFGVFLVLTVFELKFQSFFILLLLLSIATLLLPSVPTGQELLNGGEYILVFAGLIPTMALVRATAVRMDAVKHSQALLFKLPNKLALSGFQVYAHFFGSVINTGVFAMLSSAIPPSSTEQNRVHFALATLRGMVTSATWSPFFVAFVVGQVYVDSFSAWLALPLGLMISLTFMIISIFLFSKKTTLNDFGRATECLKPVLNYLVLIMILVLFCAILFNLTALSAIITVMPILVSAYLISTKKQVKSILIDTLEHMKRSTDDVVIISAAMLVGFFVTNQPDSSLILSDLGLSKLPTWSILIFIPMVMSSLSLFGIHPVISSTVLLSVYTAEQFEINHTLIMQAHLIGWSTGTMCSIASLSVITCSNLFRTSNVKLCFGSNTAATLIFGFSGGSLLTLIHLLLY